MANAEFMNQGYEYDDILKNQFDTKTFLENIKAVLNGYVYDSNSKRYVARLEKGYLNELGARQVLNEIEGRIQNINSSAYLRRDEIASIRQDIWFSLTKKLYVNSELYQIEEVNLISILKIVDDNLLLFLSRTEESGFFTKLPNFFTRKEIYSQTMAQQEQPKKERFKF